jgi:geranylgeranyl reductase family protein
MRDEFDHFLVARARESGAEVVENQKVTSLKTADKEVTVSTETDSFTGKIAVGADGATSVVGRALNPVETRDFGIALEAEVSVPEQDRFRWDSLVGMDLGCVRGGYGWVFPKREHLSIGVGAPIQRAKSLKAYYRQLLDSLDLQAHDCRRFRSHLVPVYTSGTVIQRGRMLLLGDAAGLVDPLSGEGIYNAIRSAKLAAPVISTQLRDPSSVDLHMYQKVVEDIMLPELRIARRLHRIFSWFPHGSYLALSRSDRVWRGACGIANGRHNYGDIRKRLGPLRFLLGT